MPLGQTKKCEETSKSFQEKSKSAKPFQNNNSTKKKKSLCSRVYFKVKIYDNYWKHQHKPEPIINILPFCLRLASIVTKFSKNT